MEQLPYDLEQYIMNLKKEMEQVEYEEGTDEHWKKFYHTLNIIKYFNRNQYHYKPTYKQIIKRVNNL